MKLKTSWWVAVAALVCVAVVVSASLMREQADKEPIAGPDVVSVDVIERKPPVVSPSLSEALGVAEEDMVEVGGIKRPKRDRLSVVEGTEEDRLRYDATIPRVGKSPLVPQDANSQVVGLHRDLKAGVAAASSSFVMPEAFDLGKYKADPEAYLNLIRPGRVMQTAQPGPDVKPMEILGGNFARILQGESVVIKALGEPEMPVTFHTQQLGEFENRLKTISVAADETGLAKVTYKAESGTSGMVFIQVASPVNSGVGQFVVDVKLPE